MVLTIKTGLDIVRESDFKLLAGRRIGLMTHASAVDRRLDSAYKIFSQASEVNLTTLFGPEQIPATIDPRSNIPMYSLYGSPTPDIFDRVDVMVCDIQDIGVRYYPFTWTISHILEAAGERGIEVIILDRPNPLGGAVVDGPLLDQSIGRFPVPVRHGMTLGELAHLINSFWNPTPAHVTVVRVEGWRRSRTWEGPWIPTSPSMPHLSTLWHYPGSCLVEGTTLSEGRGTALPFEIVGAPWIDAMALAARLNADWADRMGVRFRPHSFRPAARKWSGDECGGVQAHIIDPARWRPIEVWLGVMITIRSMYPTQFEWLPSESDSNIQPFDRLIGSGWVRRQIEEDVIAGKPVDEILARLAVEWLDDRHAFEAQRQPLLLYE